jgi:hypothetical protein
VLSLGSGIVLNSSGNYFLIILLGGLCSLPIVINYLRHRLDIFEPVYAFSFSTIVYFVIIPIILLSQNNFSFFRKDYSVEVGRVTFLVILSLVGFIIGYYWRPDKITDTIITHSNSELKYPSMRTALWQLSFVVFGIFATMTILWIVIAKIPLNTLWVIGQASYGDAWIMSSGPQVGYFYSARDSLIGSLLLLFVYRSKKRLPVIELFFFSVLALLLIGSGVRYRMLLLALAVILFYFMQQGERPRIWQYILVAFIIFYFIIGGIGFFRSKVEQAGQLHGLTIGEDQYSVQDAWAILIDNSQISVSTAVLIHTIPEYHSYFNGISFLNFFTQPIPRYLWPEKPTNFGQDFFDNLWPKGTTLPFWVLFYLNFGPAAVVLGMIIWGFLSRLIYDAYASNPKDEIYRIILAVYWPFIIQMYGRGGDNFAYNVYEWIFLLAPMWVILIFREKIKIYYLKRNEQSVLSYNINGK